MKRKNIDLLSLVGIGGGALLLAALCATPAPPAEQNPAATQRPMGAPFAGFPLRLARTVDFQVDEEAKDRLTGPEWRDQELDWLLIAAVQDAGLSVDEINQALFDLPAIRYGFMKPVGNFEYGDTRTAYIGRGAAIALLPVVDAHERMERLGRIADEQRKNLGKPPATLIWFEYELEPANARGRLTRKGEIDVKDLYTAASGYLESEITDLKSLSDFLAAVDDLTFAHLDGARLRLGGRRSAGHERGGITVEDFAALWLSDQGLQKRRLAGRAGVAMIAEEQPIPKGSGFSLDPQWDYERLAVDFPAEASDLRKFAKLEDAFTVEEVDAAGEGLAKKDAIPLLRLIQKLRHSATLTALLVGPDLERFVREHGYQQARYDGELQGTEVGMTLFYTDLLAKLWLMDYKGTAPVKPVDFVTDPYVKVPPIYDHETEDHPAVRQWFGPKNQGFQVANGGKDLLFAHSATHLFAASSDPAEPAAEVTPAFFFAVGIDWWDNHYEQVAVYEPQYLRLNQIMKATILLSWLAQQDSGQRLAFLAGVPVRHDNWFPEWARRRPDLRYRLWSEVAFRSRSKDASTEALPLLHTGQESGGVSLARQDLFAERQVLPELGDRLFQRSYLDYSKVDVESRSLSTFDRITFDIERDGADRAVLKASLPANTELRAADAELAQAGIERRIVRSGRAMTIETEVGGKQIGAVEFRPNERTLGVIWHSRDVDSGQSLALRLSKSEAWDATLTQHPSVKSAIRLDNDTYLVKMRDSTRWLRVTKEDAQATEATRATAESRVAAADGATSNVQLAWLDDSQVAATLRGKVEVVVEPAGEKGAAILRYETGAAQQPATRDLEIMVGGSPIKGWVQAERGAVRLRLSDLPGTLREDPIGLHDWIGPAEMKRVHEALAATPKGPVKVSLAPPPNGIFLRSLENGDFRTAARSLLKDLPGSRAALDQDLTSALRQTDSLLDRGWNAKAIEQLERLGQVHGRRPEILLRKGVAEIGRADAEAAAEALNAVASNPVHAPGAFYDEVNSQLSRVKSAAEKATVYRAAELVDWSAAQRRGLLPPGRVTAAAHGDGVGIEYHATAELNAAPIPADRVGAIGSDATVYVQDDPALSIMDWPNSTPQALHDVVAQDLGTVVSLPRGDIAHFKPAAIYAQKNGTAVKAVNHVKLAQWHSVSAAYQPYCNQRSCRQPQDEDAPVYVVLAKPHADRRASVR